MKKIIQPLLLALTVFLFYACATDEAEEPQLIDLGGVTIDSLGNEVSFCDTISFSEDVQPIFTKNCAISGCHTAADAPRLNYTTHSIISQNRQLILAAIKQEGSFKMPLDPNTWTPFKLSDTDIAIYECWIDNGAKDD